MLNLQKLKGTGVALVTPFLKSGAVDFKGLTNLVNHVTNGKVEYLVVLGTTGEAITLDKEEKQQVLQCVIAANKKKLPIVLGVGGSNTQDILSQLTAENLKGVDAILSVTPYYNKPNQNGLYAHYKAIAAKSPLPIILYNVPARTGINMTAETQLRLANDFKNIVATKEASGNVEQIMSIIQNKPTDFIVISGDDPMTLPLIASGAEGLISVVANAYPKEMSELVRLAMKHKIAAAQKPHYQLLDITKLMFAEGNPAGVKEVLQNLGVCNNYVRLPLVTVSKELSKKIEAAMSFL